MSASSSVRRVIARLEVLARTTWFRIAIAALLAALHLFAFQHAGRERLELPFNSAPGEAPYFSDPDAPQLVDAIRQPHHWSRLIVSRWDVQHYVSFATRGITACPTDPHTATNAQYMQCGLAWLPAFGLAGGVIADTTGIAPDYALLFLAILAAIVLNFLWTSPTLVAQLGLRETWATLLAFNVYPAAFHIVAPYTEGATLALALGGYLCLSRDRWWQAGLLVGATTALRAGAITLAAGLCCAAAFAAWQRRRAKQARWWRPLVAIPLSGWGLAATMVMLGIFLHEPFAYNRARLAFGDQRAVGRLVDAEFYLRGFTAMHLDSVMLLGGLAIVLLAYRYLRPRLAGDQLVFLIVASALAAIMPIVVAHTDFYWGLNRYLLLAPIIFFAAGQLAREHLAIFVLWIALCAALYWHVELCSYISHGHAGICPCLGRMEFSMPFKS